MKTTGTCEMGAGLGVIVWTVQFAAALRPVWHAASSSTAGPTSHAALAFGMGPRAGTRGRLVVSIRTHASGRATASALWPPGSSMSRSFRPTGTQVLYREVPRQYRRAVLEEYWIYDPVRSFVRG